MWTQSKIQEIQELTKKAEEISPEWFHCASEDNVADILTRPYMVKNKLPWENDLPDIELKNMTGEKVDITDLPEIIKKNAYGSGVDIWAVGVLAHIILTGFPPLLNDNICLVNPAARRQA